MPGCFATLGAYGQDTYVCRERGLVVFNSDMPIMMASLNLQTLLAEFILPAVKP